MSTYLLPGMNASTGAGSCQGGIKAIDAGGIGSSARVTPVGSVFYFEIMAPLLKVIIAMCLILAIEANTRDGPFAPRRRQPNVAARSGRQNLDLDELIEEAEGLEILREGKNLGEIFPFVGGNRGSPRPLPVQRRGGATRQFRDEPNFHEHREHHQHDENSIEAFDARPSRQGQGEDIALDIGSIAAAGERCIDKVVMVEETEYDDEIECHHSYTERCHTTYTTDFEPQQEEECEENFRKDCFIEYKKVASDEPVRFCHTPLICEGEGPVECKTVYESQCETRYHEHDVEDDIVDCETVQEEKCEDVSQGYTTEQKCTKWPKQVCNTQRKQVKKYTPETDCKKVARELCGPSGCIPQAGPEECFDKKETVVQEVPEETCNLEPQRSCKHVTKLVPLLKPNEECVDIPKEVCTRSRTNPRKVQKPVVKKWCYVPSVQSGLA